MGNHVLSTQVINKSLNRHKYNYIPVLQGILHLYWYLYTESLWSNICRDKCVTLKMKVKIWVYLYIHVYHRSFLSVHPLLARCNSSSKLSCQTYFTISPRPENALVYIVVRFRADRSIACSVKRCALDNVVHVNN